MTLTGQETAYLRSKLRRSPTKTELDIVSAEWSEHCSYKSSKAHLKSLPMSGPAVLSGRGYDSGVLDVGGGYVVTVHIESHNHPSAVEPYGGAATGVGGVIRDILSAGTRPVAILDGLRFGDISRDAHAAWLFKGAVAGIADYGNCLGVPTVGGEAEFDASYAGYALVDVAAVGFGKKGRLFRNRARPGDSVVLLGGPTGMDGVGGAQFASDSLSAEDRSAVQIPDPFIEKMIIEAVLEARNAGLIHAIKDLGGGGLSCAVSETADALGVGIAMDTARVHTRSAGMLPGQIMTSESQERMLIILPPSKEPALQKICSKFSVKCSRIGRVTASKDVCVRSGAKTVAKMPASLVAHAPLLDWPSARPKYLDVLPDGSGMQAPASLSRCILRLMGSPNLGYKGHIYSKYDHEVGIRTVIRPGRDAALLRLDNGRHLAVKIDGSPKHCYVDPYAGAAGCFEEACRNVACTGSKPIGMVDHLQFGSPEDPEVFWTFLESLRAISDFAIRHKIPCVGGKVSLYNETERGPIKPTPVIGVLGLSSAPLLPAPPKKGDYLVIIGTTKDEIGGSEYAEFIHKLVGGRCPQVDHAESAKNMSCILGAIRKGLLRAAHDCSKGGLAAAVCEMCMDGPIGCSVRLSGVPSEPGLPYDRLLFSESHSRYLIAVDPAMLRQLEQYLEKRRAAFAVLGRFGGGWIRFLGKNRRAGSGANLMVDKVQKAWLGSLRGSV